MGPPKASLDLSTALKVEKVTNNINGTKQQRLHIQSPSDSLSRKGSWDFSAIFSNKQRQKNINRDDDKDTESETDTYFFRIIQTKKSFTFMVDDRKDFKHWLSKLEQVIFGNVLQKGYLFMLHRLSPKQKDKKTKMDKKMVLIA